MEYFKLQLGCLLVVVYVMATYLLERRTYKIKKREKIFEWLLLGAFWEIIFDGATAYTVNHLETIPDWINRMLHLGFLCSLDGMVFLVFLYITDISGHLPKSLKKRVLLCTPLLLNIAMVVGFIGQLEYLEGKITNYSMGISAYTCFAMVAVYMIATVALLLKNQKNLGRHKMVTISTCLAATVVVTLWQMIWPEALITSLVSAIIIVGSYLNMENPLFTKLQTYNQEMVMGFATLVENRDGSTGGHIRRTTEYVKMLAEELWARDFYREWLTKDYMKNLVLAAPMHDVGKIAIPDAILQKPGKLTDEEYTIMKTHTELGGKIILDTFDSMGDDEYEKMAYEVAKYHHEKWNGKGYPEGLSHNEIPLCARIMSVADVFDAVSAKRCYRDAMPLEECFQIIKEGSGRDFDPLIVEVFLSMEEKIRNVVGKL